MMDALRLVRAIPSPAIGVDVRAHHHHHHVPLQVSAVGPRAAAHGGGAETAGAAAAASVAGQYSYVFPRPLSRMWTGGGGGAKGSEEVEVREEEAAATEEEEVATEEEAAATEEEEEERRRNNWVVKILRVRSLWAEGEEGKSRVSDEEEDDEEEEEDEEGDRGVACGVEEGSEARPVEDDEEEEEAKEERIVFDRDSFSRLLTKVSLAEAQRYAKMSYLGYLAYIIPKIKPKILLQYHGLNFVTSSLEKRKNPLGSNESERKDQNQEAKDAAVVNDEAKKKQKGNGYRISASAAYHIAASAASYLQSRTMGILPFGHGKEQSKDGNSTEAGAVNENGNKVLSSVEASFVATTHSVTAMVAAKEETKQAVAKDLNSAQSSPCEWFICDDDGASTRYFVIQGSETLASWQANLLFEPIEFEGLDVLVHRGIYEAAKGIYQQMLPEIKAHLNSRGNSATLSFTGHSLGGSLALLVNLMLLIRGDAPASSLLPVITFGAPSIMCGGDHLLRKLGLPKSHVQAITMHRDIVPRAFSCHYPDHVANILKTVNGNFRKLPCLNNQKHKMLYVPMGVLLILQPDEKFSPHHHLLPSGSGLYLLGGALNDSADSRRLLRAAQAAFLNSPHPLEILSDRSAYGSEGTVYRDHDMNSYLKSIRCVIRREHKRLRKTKREQRRHMWWPIVVGEGVGPSIVIGTRGGSATTPNRHHFSFAGVFHGGRETLRRFGRLVASQHVQMFIVLLLPARLLLLGTLSIVS